MAEAVPRTKLAPEPLDLVQGLVNTRNRMRGCDRLGTADHAAAWLAELGYESPGAKPDCRSLERLRDIRESLREVLASHTRSGTQEEADADVAASDLNQLLSSVRLGVDFSPAGEPRLTSSSTGDVRFLDDLSAAIVWSQYVGLWGRLKVCRNEQCRWAFYDRTKNQSGSWCVMDICGSRAKMRAYRKRQSP